MGPEKICLKSEYGNYELPAIASCQYIRNLLNPVRPNGDDAEVDNTSTTKEQPCLVFE
jgi:hypothetical protein